VPVAQRDPERDLAASSLLQLQHLRPHELHKPVERERRFARLAPGVDEALVKLLDLPDLLDRVGHGGHMDDAIRRLRAVACALLRPGGFRNGPGRPSSLARSPRSHRSTNAAYLDCSVWNLKRSAKLESGARSYFLTSNSTRLRSSHGGFGSRPAKNML